MSKGAHCLESHREAPKEENGNGKLPPGTSTWAGEKPEMLPISLGCFQFEKNAPCDLFLQVGSGHYTLFAGEGIAFDRKNRRSLVERGVRNLYIRNEDITLYFNFMIKTVADLVRDPSCSPEKKAEAVYFSCRDLLNQIFFEPRASFLNQAQDIISPTVDLIVSDDYALRHLVKLTQYDSYTYTHSANVGVFGVALVRSFFGARSAHDLKKLGMGFFLHDMGKCQIPLDILNKPGPLDDREWEMIKGHPQQGYAMLEEVGFDFEEVRIITLQHHERDDGGGYPDGLNAGEIHPYGRICRLVDVYDALTSDRSYHQRLSTFSALKLMKEDVLADMDNDLFQHFVRLFDF